MKLIFLLYYAIVQTTITYASNQYLGCFIDQVGDRDLNIFISDYEHLTPRQCIRACQEQNLPYAGIQYGNECRCGQHYGTYGQVSDDECHYTCPTSEKCGGDNRNSIYSAFYSTCQNKLAGYQGCFSSVDLKSDTKFVDSIEECIEVCAIKYDFAGIMNGNLCYCGNDLNIPLSDKSLCNTLCHDSSNNCCGGLQVLSVYDIKTYQLSLNKMPLEKLIRVRRANAVNDTTISSVQTTQTSAPSMAITSMSRNASILSTLLNSETTNHPSTASSSTYGYTSVHSSLPISITSTNTLRTLVTSSYLNTGTSSMLGGTSALLTNSTIHMSTAQFSSTPSTGSFSSTYPYTSQPISTSKNAVTSVSSSPVPMTSITSSGTSLHVAQFTSIVNSLASSTSTVMTVSQQNNSGTSISNTLPSSSTSSFLSSSTTVGLQTSINSSLNTAAPVQTEVTTMNNTSNSTSTTSQIMTTTTTTTTVSTAATTTVSASYAISTIIVPLSQNFTPTDNATRESVRQGLIKMTNFAFTCLYNPSNTNCTQTGRRRKRQACSSGYNVNLLSDLNDVSTNATKQYQVNYDVVNLCSGTFVTPLQLKTATDSLSRTQIVRELGFDYTGDLIRSTSIGNTQSNTPDPKLWIIGAVLGPVGFVLLLIFVFCYLHYKCRPRPANRALAKNIYTKPPPVSARSTTYKTMPEEPLSEKPKPEKTLPAIAKVDPLVGLAPPSHRLTPTESERSSIHSPRQPVPVEVPMDEIRRQNDVEKWRNKLRLQEKFHPTPDLKLPDLSIPNTGSSSSSQYDNQAFQHDKPIINIQPTKEVISINSPRRLPPPTKPEVEVGRTKLHRLLDEVLDKAESDEGYNPDSETERRKRRRQRRRINSVSDDRQALPVNNKRPEIPHVPIIPQVNERPDPSVLRLHHNPYEAGDRAHALANIQPIELRRKYSTDDSQAHQYTARSNPPLFFDASNMADRASTATDAYAIPKRVARTRLETDREAMMRYNDGRVDRRQQQLFNDDPAYMDSAYKDQDGHRAKTGNAWEESNLNNYPEEFKIAKKSAINTKNIISSINDELQHMTVPSSKNYHA